MYVHHELTLLVYKWKRNTFETDVSHT